jgi:hypothetical protein
MALFAGRDVERLLLKMLMGLCGAKAARTPQGEHLPWSPPAPWLRILFGQHDFPPAYGLYMQGRIGAAQTHDPGHVQLAPLTTENEISGALVSLVGITFVLAMRTITGRRAGAIDDDSIYRPGELLYVDTTTATQHSIFFAWRGEYTTQVRHEWRPGPVANA